jgi:hypothetical protein
MIGRCLALFLFGAALLGGCHGSTLDIIDPGGFGHTPPPAANLPQGDCPAAPNAANLCAQ